MSNNTETHVNPRDVYLNASVFFLCSLFISFTEFFPYLSKVFLFPLILLIVFFFVAVSTKTYVNWHVIFFVFTLFGLVLILFIKKDSVNGLLISPVLSYMTCVVSRDVLKDDLLERSLDIFLKFVIVFLLFVSIFEVLIKLNFFVVNIYNDFIVNYGDGRFDVLRTRVLWASSLSSAAVGIFFTFYFSLVRKNFVFLCLVLFYIVLTGSRTAIVLFIIMIFVSLIKNWSFWEFKYSKRSLITMIISIPFFIFIFAWLLNSRMGSIVTRSFTIKADSSFTGRGDTTGAVFERLLASLPDSLFWGLANDGWVSDSAFTSIAAHSSILLLFLFVGYLFLLIFNTSLGYIVKYTFILVTLLGGATIGDFFIPVVSFLYTLTFLIYEKNSTRDYWTK